MFKSGGTYVELVGVCQIMPQGVGGGVNSTASFDLAVDIGYVALNGSDAKNQCLGNFPVA